MSLRVPVVSFDVCVSWFIYIFACQCVEAEERKRERVGVCVCAFVCMCVRMSVCVFRCGGLSTLPVLSLWVRTITYSEPGEVGGFVCVFVCFGRGGLSPTVNQER